MLLTARKFSHLTWGLLLFLLYSPQPLPKDTASMMMTILCRRRGCNSTRPGYQVSDIILLFTGHTYLGHIINLSRRFPMAHRVLLPRAAGTFNSIWCKWGFSDGSAGKESACNAGDPGSIPVSGRSPKEELAAHSSILPGEDHGQRSLMGYSPWGCKESDTTEVT